MVNRKNWLGVLVIALVFEMMVVGCGDGSNSGGGNPLIGKWYFSQQAADDDDDGTDATYEFTSDRKLLVGGSDSDGFTYTVSGNTLTVKVPGFEMGKTTFSISGTKLTLDNTFTPFLMTTLYKSVGSGGGGGGGGGSGGGGGTNSSQGLNNAKNILKGWGYTGTFYTPDQGTFDQYYQGEDEYGDWLAIVFKNSSLSDFNAYKNKWNAYISSSITQARSINPEYSFYLNLRNNIYAQILFTSSGGTEEGFTILPNSIVFMAYRD